MKVITGTLAVIAVATAAFGLTRAYGGVSMHSSGRISTQ